MSEIMRPLPFRELMDRALSEYGRSKSVFGIREEKFYRNKSGKRVSLFGRDIDSPIGPAAGPNSQLAQNIAASYLTGGRFIELKTVQTMDGEELRNCVPRPCINALDEGYNVEWSTELTVREAFGEYVKAWFLVHILGKKFSLDTNVIFNMSVGYSLDGIKSKKIDDYIEGLKDASNSEAWKECAEWIRENEPGFEALPSCVSDSVTLSTLHGCPREEIEKIAHYLLTKKKVHTNIKCNPTLLGYESARDILDSMGYGYVSFDDHHFNEDLQYGDAVDMLRRLKDTAGKLGLAFGVKITNTFPVEILRGELPGEEMYMSGRALFPLSLTVAGRLSEAFGGSLPISFSGGADAFNIKDLIGCGIAPVTFATTILKPGGYERLRQIAEIAEGVAMPADGLDVPALAKITDSFLTEDGYERHRKGYREAGSRKTDRVLPLVDCADAPCSHGGCPIEQQIPAYLEKVAVGDMAGAFNIIANDNVLPSVTGTICDHQCQNKCTRVDYEDPLEIRSAKKAASEAAQAAFTNGLAPGPVSRKERIMIIGAGPAGLAAAVYLRRNGFDVTVRERREKPLGIVSHVIPAFRISDAEMALDTDMAFAYGISVEYGADPVYDLAALKNEYDAVVLATGAWGQGRSSFPIDGNKTFDALDFLERSRSSGLKLPLGNRVCVIGGGDVAMDCARAAARNDGSPEVTIVYRRTKGFMPAQKEEIELALADGVKIKELLAPKSFEGGVLTCDLMKLGDYDESGRRAVERTGEAVTENFDTVISAVGAVADTSAFAANGLALDDRGFAITSDACESSMSGVYIAGDCRKGPATVVKAMADAKHIALDIMEKAGVEPDFKIFEPTVCREDLIVKKGVLTGKSADNKDAERCLSCGLVCEVCADVCPNRANIAVDTGDAFAQRFQIVHMDGMCNECGNCTTFCPSTGEPCKDKFTIFESEEDFNNSGNIGALKTGSGYLVRNEERRVTDGAAMSETMKKLIAVLERENYM